MLCLFVSPSFPSLMLASIIFLIVFVVAAFNVVKPTAVFNKNEMIVKSSLTVLIACIGLHNFFETWTPSSKVGMLADALGMTKPIFLLMIGILGCIAGAYAMYVLACWLVSEFTMILGKWLPAPDKDVIKSSLKQNWYFPISALAFFSLARNFNFGYIIGLGIAFLIAFLVASRIPSIISYIKKHTRMLRLLSSATAIGICLAGQEIFYTRWSIASTIQAIEAKLPFSVDVSGVISIFGAVVALPFVYFCVLMFWDSIINALKESSILSETKNTEWIIYGVLLIASLSFMMIVFIQSQAFYGTQHSYDIIYTSDSPDLVKGNVYLALTHYENDLRQPLFAVFASPFMGIPYLAARLIGASATVRAVLLNSVQVIMLFMANFMLAKAMKLNLLKRICFMILTSCTYTQLLFTLMMEQYIIAYFWLVFCIYLIVEKQQLARVALWGAGGTMLTSMVLLPFMSKKSPIKDFKSWFMDMIKYGFEFVALMLAFCRFDVFFNLISKISPLSKFTGNTITAQDKIYQYFEFIKNCIFAPSAGINITAHDYTSWQMNTTTSLNKIGILILALAVISAIMNRDKKSSLLAVAWVMFSAVMLLGIGWGTKENGLILYALYFGWAFLVLVFQLIEKIENKLNVRFIIPAFTFCLVIVFLVINIPAIMDLVNFATTYYPV